jgi:putative membrane protein
MSVYRPVAAMFAVATLLSMSASVPVLAQSGAATSITHRQSVRTDMSPSGEIDASRVFTQLTVQGEGDVEVVLPDQATRSLRNLDAFGRPDIDGDQVTFSVVATPDGTHERTVATHSGPMPIELEVAYRLDGSTIAPEDLVGGSGQLEVSYTVRNTTAEPTEITYRDGVGAKHTETIDVAVPFVGSISMELDGRFVGIDAPGAAVAGNGRGDTFVSWSMVLFEPVGSEEQTVTYTAQVTDAIVPAVVAQFLPVDSNSFTSLASVEETFGAVADGLREIAGGGLQIDANLQALAIGSGQLLSGVTRLANGSDKLADGLNDTAIPGARRLADGTGAASAGSAELASGLGQLSSGAGELSAGLGTASAGSGQLSSGLGELETGAGALSDGLDRASAGSAELAAGLGGSAAPGAQELADGLSQQAAPGAAQLEAGLTSLLTAFGSSTDGPNAGTVLGGVATLLNGLQNDLAPGTGAMRGLSAGLAGSFGPDATGNDAGDRAAAAAGAAGQLAAGAAGIGQAAEQVDAALQTLEGTPLDPTQQALVAGARSGVGQIEAGAVGLQGGATQLQDGLAAQALALGSWPSSCEAAIGAVQTSPTPTGLQVIRALSCISVSVDDGLTKRVIPGVKLLQGGLDNPACKPQNPTDPANPCGVKQVLGLLQGGATQLSVGLDAAAAGAGELATGLEGASEGSSALAAGLVQLDDGAGRLAAGAGRAASGAQDLSAGLVRLDDGGRQLAAGASRAESGAGELSDGLVQIDDGANQLADGLGDAGDGATTIADGLKAVEDGMTGVAEGSQRLTDEGTSQLVAGASEATATPAIAVEHAIAADARGQAGEGLPYPTVDGAEASAVYQFELAGIGSEDGGTSLPVLLLATLLGLAVAGGLALVVRQRMG